MARKGSRCADGTNAVSAPPLWRGGINSYRRTQIARHKSSRVRRIVLSLRKAHRREKGALSLGNA
jgi:hypothetical protein